MAVRLKINSKPQWPTTRAAPKPAPAFTPSKAKTPVGIGAQLLPSVSRSPAPAAPAAPAAPPVAGAGPQGSPGTVPQGTGPLNPMDPGMEGQISAREKAQQTALAAIAAQKAQTGKEFFDPNNPFSRQAALRRQFQSVRGAQHINQASSGHLYSGSSATENAFTNLDEGQGNIDLKRSYDDIIGQLNSREAQENTSAAEEIFGLQSQMRAQYAADPANTPKGTNDHTGEAAAADVQPTQAQIMAAIGMPGGATPRPAVANAKPKTGYTHVQTTGPRAGLSYKIVNGVKVYENGDRMKVTS